VRHIIKKILKEETNNFELVKNLIYTMFDNVRVVEYIAKRNEVMVYYQGSSDLAPTEICDMITKYTGLHVIPWYEYGTKKYGTKNNNDEPDFYIDTEKYEETINESKPDEVEKNLNVIRTILKQVSWDGLCDIWVEYNKMDGEYEIRSKYTNLDFDIDNTQKELEFLDSIIRSMGIRVYIYTPWFVDSCEDDVKFINEAKYNSQKKIIENVLNTIVLPEYEHVICGFEVKEPHERFNTVGTNPFKNISVTVTFIGGPGTKLWPQTQGVQRMYDGILDEVWDVIYNYTNEGVDVYHKNVKDCGKKNIYLRESKENYSPAGKEIIPNKIVIHKSNPKVRDKISNEGLKVRAGECYKIYAGYGEKCIPAIFATNSTNKRASFDSTYDDDVWEINTEMIPDVKWYKDKHYESRSKHIVTFENIPVDAITLKHEGTGKDWGLMESIDKSENNKLKIVKDLIHTLFDEVSFIDIKKYNDKPLLKIYFESESVSYDTEEFGIKIYKSIYDYTGIVVAPSWAKSLAKVADFYLYCEHIEYDDEGNVINENYSSEGKETEPKYLSLIKELVEPFKDEEGVCDINVSYDDEDDMYSVYIVIGTEEMNEKFFYVPAMNSHISKLRMGIKKTIKQYIPIDNLYVGSYGIPNCEWDPIS
jgi:hypothetical protein